MLGLGRWFLYTRGKQFGDLYHMISFFFAESFKSFGCQSKVFTPWSVI